MVFGLIGENCAILCNLVGILASSSMLLFLLLVVFDYVSYNSAEIVNL